MSNPAPSKASADTMAGFVTALTRFVTSFFRYGTTDAIIDSVDEAKFTCNITIRGVIFYNLPLTVLNESQASFVKIPKVGSNCHVSFLDASKERPILTEVDECDKIIFKIYNSTLEITKDLFNFNNGKLGGFVKVIELTTKLNNIENQMNKILQNLKSIKIVIPPGGGAYAGVADFGTIIPLQTTSQSEIENTKITQ